MTTHFRPHWTGPACPESEAHGRLLDWPGSTTAYYCPAASHKGPRFFTTDLVPVGRPVEGQTRRPVPPLGPSSASRPVARTPSGRAAV